ncbi:MAG: type II secretion system protein [bacterium]|nr:type II secretion system protein [bacterium]
MKINTQKNKKGFTMIELLVVISVIALLVALVLVAVSMARVKANNSRIKGDMDQLRKQAEVIYVANGMTTYCKGVVAGDCFSNGQNPQVILLRDDIVKRSYAAAYPNLIANDIGYCISSKMANNNRLCYDSSGKQTTGMCSGIVCQ